MTQMPEMVSLFNGFGGAASLLLGWATINMQTLTGYENTSILILLTIVLTVMIGGITFSGSLVAWGKLSGKISTKAMIFAGLRELSILHLLALLGFSFFLFMNPAMYCGFTFSFFWR